MLGWSVIVSTQTPEERDADTQRTAAVLASWETGVYGTKWLHQWIDGGIAQVHQLKGGYPNRYIVPAHRLLPLLSEGTPFTPGTDIWAYDEWNDTSRLISGSENWSVETHPEKIAACPPDKLLTVEVWDLS